MIVAQMKAHEDQWERKGTKLTRRIKMFKKIIAPLLATLFVASLFGTLVGCNTIGGAGTDIQQGGKAIKDEAHEQQRNRAFSVSSSFSRLASDTDIPPNLDFHR